MTFPASVRPHRSKLARLRKGFCLAATALLLAAARPHRAPAGDLVLDAADPVLSVTIAGVPLRLRVDLDRRTSVELNPEAADRLTLPWEEDVALNVGRISMEGRTAVAKAVIAGRALDLQVARYDRPCCAGVDGAVGADLLPFATVRWVRGDAPPPNGTRVLPLDRSDRYGLSAALPDVALRFGSAQPLTTATAAAGGILARAWRGRWDGPPASVPAAFGIARPVRLLGFALPGTLAGFRFERLLVRTLDFPGTVPLPEDDRIAGEVVVAHRLSRQGAWPSVTLGADRLDRCREIVYTAVPRTLTLHCAFDRP